MGKTIRLGLTGGIGSGKSTVAGMLADLGATVVDADAISRAVTAPGGAAIGPLKDAFGAGMVTPRWGSGP
jgi:dephospho-CoA kinase